MKNEEASERVLVLVRGVPEECWALDLLANEGLDAVLCRDVDELCSQIEAGMGAALVADELLGAELQGKLHVLLRRQPVWSAYPLIFFGAPGAERAFTRTIAPLAHVTFLERPLHARSLSRSIHAALGARRRQYETRQAIESRDAFFAVLSHELRNPLSALSLAVNLLKAKVPDAGGSREYAIIERQLGNLTGLVDDLLDVARVTHGKVSLNRQRVDLAEVVRSVFETLESRARDQRLSWALEAQEPLPWVLGDRQRLEQVFGNLLTNAIKYTPPGGRVRVEVRRDGDAAEVVVQDSGIGLGSDMVTRVFELFVQVERSRDRAQGGLGLGLTLARGIVHLHGGTLHAKSEGVGCGSTFIVRLPRASSSTAPAPVVSAPALDTAPRSVLVVEDHPDIRDLLAELLTACGHSVTCAHEGHDGLEKLVTSNPEIAFIDIGLPNLDGLELSRLARARGSRAWLVALTGYGQTEDKARAKAAGFDDHLVKPVSRVSLERALSRAPLRSHD